ncbi:helix-turn-helix transcriptional regulator [Ciceribacter sp. L1K22]|uniref:helix-turn-helix transcriptional regulator n=1 Tax=Ciceribacter sp. L1K22 TaxID=2820275 RepID=UPI001ABD9F95|nr:helix-turn-helix transcriptional regulator [Ciceribacter sp. L1K22]MBO3758426.1 helix-turn-helix transcriptional regulator [Ciceribacter sp. L1K22]
MEKGFAAWNRTLAELLASEGQPDFEARVESALKTVLEFDVFMVFGYNGASRPTAHYYNIDPHRAATVIEAYAAGPYLLDPFYAAATNAAITGVRRLRDMAPDQFYSSEYFRRHYALTGIRDEVGIVCRPASGYGVVVSFTRPVGSPAFGRRDLDAVHAVEPVIRLLVERHYADSGASDRHHEQSRTPPDTINACLDRMTDGLLTPREIEITSLILRGHSNMSIAESLHIAEGTVKIHRKNIYHKLEISSQAELFARFISELAV